jgi:hypothetical protein
VENNKIVIRILLIVAKMFADVETKQEIEKLAVHISVNVK